jgi:hypothetical protein
MVFWNMTPRTNISELPFCKWKQHSLLKIYLSLMKWRSYPTFIVLEGLQVASSQEPIMDFVLSQMTSVHTLTLL